MLLLISLCTLIAGQGAWLANFADWVVFGHVVSDTCCLFFSLFTLEAYTSQAGAHYSGEKTDMHCNSRLLLPHSANQRSVGAKFCFYATVLDRNGSGETHVHVPVGLFRLLRVQGKRQ